MARKLEKMTKNFRKLQEELESMKSKAELLNKENSGQHKVRLMCIRDHMSYLIRLFQIVAEQNKKLNELERRLRKREKDLTEAREALKK